MKNALNIDSFEHFFNETTLKKGLYIFEKNRIKNIAKIEGGEYIFKFKGKGGVTLHLTKKLNKISWHLCSCKTKNNCEHICAAIFFFIKDELNFKKTRKLNTVSSKNEGDELLDQSCEKLKALINRYSNIATAQKIIPEPNTAFSIIKTFREQNKRVNPILIHLTIINEFSNFISLKNPGSEESESALHQSIKYLNLIKPRLLSDIDKKIWLSATKNSLKNNKKFHSGVFTFLVSFAANIITEKKDFEDLKTSLNKRHLKQTYPHYLDFKLIAQLQFQIKEQELFQTSQRLFLKDTSPELSVAQAELKFCVKKVKAGFKILESDYDKIKKNKPHNFISFIEYIIDKANGFKNKQLEIYFIKELMLYDYRISPKYLKRIKELLDNKEREEQANEVIKELKKKSPEIYFDKVATILESENRLDELIQLISKQADKFYLINRIAIKKLPQYDDFLLDNYIKHFIYTVAEARETFHQKQIYDKALVYLEQLPKPVLVKMLLQMLDKISKSNFIYRHLNKLSESLSPNTSEEEEEI